MSRDLHRDMYPHISFFMFLGIRKERYPAALKDYSLFVSWLSLLLLLKSNKTINRQISSNEVTKSTTFPKRFPFEKDRPIILQILSKNNTFHQNISIELIFRLVLNFV